MCSRSDDPSEHEPEIALALARRDCEHRREQVERLRLDMIEAQLRHAIGVERLKLQETELAVILRDIYGTPEERRRARGLLKRHER